MYCRKCGEQIPDDATFCPQCGVQVEVPKNESTNKLLYIVIAVLILAIGTYFSFTSDFTASNPNGQTASNIKTKRSEEMTTQMNQFIELKGIKPHEWVEYSTLTEGKTKKSYLYDKANLIIDKDRKEMFFLLSYRVNAPDGSLVLDYVDTCCFNYKTRILTNIARHTFCKTTIPLFIIQRSFPNAVKQKDGYLLEFVDYMKLGKVEEKFLPIGTFYEKGILALYKGNTGKVMAFE